MKEMMGYDLLISSRDDESVKEEGASSPQPLDPVLEQNLANVLDGDDTAILSSHVIHWNRPWRTERRIQKSLMGVVAQCANRTVYDFHMDDATGEYRLRPAHNLDSRHTPMVSPTRTVEFTVEEADFLRDRRADVKAAIFAPNLREVAARLFGPRSKGRVFAVFATDPMESYLEWAAEVEAVEGHELAEGETREHYMNHNHNPNLYNPMIRSLVNVPPHRPANRKDLELAQRFLKDKVLIGTCARPEETMQRLTFEGSERNQACQLERKKFRHMCEEEGGGGGNNGKQTRRRRVDDPRMEELVRFRNRYDVALFEYVKGLFEEQGALFSDG